MREEVDLKDALKARVEAGENIVISGVVSKETTTMIDDLAESLALETGKPVRLIQIVDLPELPVAKN